MNWFMSQEEFSADSEKDRYGREAKRSQCTHQGPNTCECVNEIISLDEQ